MEIANFVIKCKSLIDKCLCVFIKLAKDLKYNNYNNKHRNHDEEEALNN